MTETTFSVLQNAHTDIRFHIRISTKATLCLALIKLSFVCCLLCSETLSVLCRFFLQVGFGIER